MANPPPPPTVTPASRSDAASPEAALSLLIEQTLTHIRNKQITLQEMEHTPRRMRKQLDQLKSGIEQIEHFILREDVGLDPGAKAEHQEDLADIRHFVDQIAANVDTDSDVSAKINRLNLRNGFELLRRLLDEVQVEMQSLNPPDSQAEDAEVAQDLKLLRQALKRQRHRLSRDTLGTPLNSAIAKRLNRLAGLLHRIDCISHRRAARSRTLGSIALQLRPLVQQIDRAVDRLDRRETSAPELLEETEVFVERQLHRYEYWPGLSWIASRFSDINRSRSPQSRVLLGLSSSLSVSLVTFLFLIGIFSSISNGLEEKVPKNLQLEEQRNEALQTLKDEVEQLRKKETEQKTNLSALRLEYEQEAQRAPNQQAQQAAGQPPSTSPAATLDAPTSPEIRDSTVIESLQQKDQTLISDIQDLQSKVDKQLSEISALTSQIENALKAGQGGSDNSLSEGQQGQQGQQGQSDPESSGAKAGSRNAVKLVNSWLNNQQIINHLNRIILAAFAGALGSMMSILIRLDKLDDEQLNYPYALGFLKPFIGAVFGVIVFAILSTKVVDILPAGFNIHEDTPSGSTTLQRRDPLGSIDSQEIYKIFVAAFIAGFSERLANDTLKPLVGSRD